ncbi:hypothetical protein GCM10027395_05700 [Giesbergeria sinuosa]
MARMGFKANCDSIGAGCVNFMTYIMTRQPWDGKHLPWFSNVVSAQNAINLA